MAGSWTDGGTVTLPITYTSTPAIVGTMSNTTNTSYSGTPKIFNKGTSSFRISANQSNEILNSSLSFSVIGY